MKKTLFLLDNRFDGYLVFFQLNGDYSHLDGLQMCHNYDDCDAAMVQKRKELTSILTCKGQYKGIKSLKNPTKDWNYFASVGCQINIQSKILGEK